MNFLRGNTKSNGFGNSSIVDPALSAYGTGAPAPGMLRGSSKDVFQDASIFIFTTANGLIGRMIGRNLKLRVDRFVVDYYREQPSASASSNNSLGPLRVGKVICPANSILAMTEVDKNKFDRVPLTFAECVKVDRRVDKEFLESARYPTIVYEVQTENEKELVGTLSLHGTAQLVKCAKDNQGPEMVITCPVIQSQYGITPFRSLLGLIGVADKVEVQVRIPTKLL